MSFIYLASPYSHVDAKVRQARFERVVREAARLMQKGHAIFCPISHSHPIDQVLPRIEGHNFWMGQDIPILRHAEKMVVLMLDGWRQSTGIKTEIEFCKAAHIPIEYITDGENGEEALKDRHFDASYGGTSE